MSRYAGDTNLSLLDKLLNKIVINQYTGCWEWQASINNIGYGLIRDGKKMRTAHRASYEEHVGTIPHGMCVCHTCDNPKCINPSHLWLGTRKQNTQDMISKGRAKNFGVLPGQPGPRKGVKLPKKHCIHCSRDIATPGYAKYHGDKCKHKPVSINRI
jgi:hypothetical protein